MVHERAPRGLDVHGDVGLRELGVRDDTQKEVIDRPQRALLEVEVVVATVARVEVAQLLVPHVVPEPVRLADGDHRVGLAVDEEHGAAQVRNHLLVWPGGVHQPLRYAAEEVAGDLLEGREAALHDEAARILPHLRRDAVGGPARCPGADGAAVPHDLRGVHVELVRDEVQHGPHGIVDGPHARGAHVQPVAGELEGHHVHPQGLGDALERLVHVPDVAAVAMRVDDEDGRAARHRVEHAGHARAGGVPRLLHEEELRVGRE